MQTHQSVRQEIVAILHQFLIKLIPPKRQDSIIPFKLINQIKILKRKRYKTRSHINKIPYMALATKTMNQIIQSTKANLSA